MKRIHRPCRVDGNHGRVKTALLNRYVRVWDTSAVGGGFPDLLAWTPTKGLVLLETKDGDKPPSKRKLTPAQIRFHALFPVSVVNCEAEACAVMGVSA